jgi:two-component system phosphate regulon sensor histidine kinase PhoR
VFTEDQVEKAAKHFKKRKPVGASRLFIYKFALTDRYPLRLYFYDPKHHEMLSSVDDDVWRPISNASSPWLHRYKNRVLDSDDPIVNETDPDNRIILKPILDEASRLVGFAGMLIDPEYFVDEMLPAAFEKALPKFFRSRDYENLIVTVRDGRGDLVVSTGEAEGEDEVVRAIPFVFSDWRLGLQSRFATPEQWARSNFALNLTLSILLAVALIGGIALALRTASREIHVSQMKADFVSNVSHELRTPLSSVRVFGEFLSLGRVTERDKIREYGDYIETESRRLTQLINNILDFSKIESGQKTYRFKVVDVGDVIDRTLKTFEVRLKHEGFEIECEHGPEPLYARVDVDAIDQAFHNLVDNAVKYSGTSKSIVVKLDRADGFVRISVRDNGIGISKSEQKKVFDRFHRVGTGLVHDVKGSGLGLAIVSHVVSAHGGKVTLESEPGRGSVFSIHLPVVSAAVAEADVEDTELPAAASTGKG